MSSTVPPAIAILVRGLPGSGKTYLAARLQERLGSGVIMLDPDATDYGSQAYKQHVARLTAEGVDSKLHAYRFLRGQAYEAIAEHQTFIWNQPFTNLEIFNKMTANLQAQAAEHQTELLILVVEVEVDPELAKQRVSARKEQGGHGPSDATFERFVGDYTSFASEGYQTVTVHGGDDVDASIAKIMSALGDLRASSHHE